MKRFTSFIVCANACMKNGESNKQKGPPNRQGWKNPNYNQNDGSEGEQVYVLKRNVTC